MKKTISVFLAILMCALMFTPVFAADGKSSVTFVGPDAAFFDADAYGFCPASEQSGYEFVIADPTDAKFTGLFAYVLPSYFKGDTAAALGGTKYSFDKSTQTYVADAENGTYYLLTDIFPLTDLTDEGITSLRAADASGNIVFYNGGAEMLPGKYLLNGGKYVLLADIVFADDQQKIWNRVINEEGFHFYTPVVFDNGTAYEYDNGSTLVFRVMTNEKYDPATIIVTANGSILPANQKGEYAVIVDRDLTIRVIEKDENNKDILLRNHYKMTLTSGDGYSVKPLKGENNKLVYYGDSYSFRVKITSGFTGDGMKVMAVRGSNDLLELLGDDEEFDMLYTLNLDGSSETLTSNGVDADGYRTYTVKNITSDCKIIVSGVQEESKSGILSLLKRILRAILHIFNIHILDDALASCTVNIDSAAAIASGVTYTVSSSGKTEGNQMSLEVLKGESIAIELTKKNENQGVTVTWDGKDPSYTEPKWTAHYNRYTGETTWTTTYYIDNIQAEVTNISITATN